MDEYPLLRITEQDVAEANRLSLGCPICASAVENNAENPALAPVVCANCGTLYHQACWTQKGGKCAMLGCEHETSYPYGQHTGPVLTIKASDLPREAPRYGSNGYNKRLKEAQRREVERLRRPGFWQRLWQWLLDQIRFD